MSFFALDLLTKMSYSYSHEIRVEWGGYFAYKPARTLVSSEASKVSLGTDTSDIKITRFRHRVLRWRLGKYYDGAFLFNRRGDARRG